MSIPIRLHTLKKGETYAGVLKKAGFSNASAKAIYTRYNPKLKKSNPDPSTLKPGDVIRFPAFTRAEIEAAWHKVFNARNKLIDPLETQANMLNRRVGPLKKMVSDAKAHAKAQIEMLKVSDIKWTHPIEKEVAQCRKDMADPKSNKPLGEMIKCEMVIVEYVALVVKMKHDIEMQIREVDEMVARYDKMLKDTQDRITQLKNTVTVVESTFDVALNPIGRMAKETY